MKAAAIRLLAPAVAGVFLRLLGISPYTLAIADSSAVV
jgi:hypothetical protein